MFWWFIRIYVGLFDTVHEYVTWGPEGRILGLF